MYSKKIHPLPITASATRAQPNIATPAMWKFGET